MKIERDTLWIRERDGEGVEIEFYLLQGRASPGIRSSLIYLQEWSTDISLYFCVPPSGHA
jgi:hypothetical protein